MPNYDNLPTSKSMWDLEVEEAAKKFRDLIKARRVTEIVGIHKVVGEALDEIKAHFEAESRDVMRERSPLNSHGHRFGSLPPGASIGRR